MKKTALIMVFILLASVACAEEPSKAGARKAVESAQYSVEQMSAAGFEVAKINKTLSEAEASFRNRYYGKSIQLSARIDSTRKEAFSTYSLLSDARYKINENSKAGFDVKYARDLIVLAQAEFDKEDYGEATRLVNDALLANQAAAPIVRKTIVNKIKRNIRGIILALAILAAALYVGYPKLLARLYNNRISGMVREEAAIKNKLKDLEERRFVKKILSAEEYDDTRQQYERRLSEIEKQAALAKKKISELKK